MRNERKPNGQGAEIPGHSNGLTPETLNQKLRSIRRKIDYPIIYSSTAVLCGFVTILTVVDPRSIEPNLRTAAVVAGAVAGTFAAYLAAKDISNIVTETSRITGIAVKRGFGVSGLIFKRIKPTPKV